ncbi:Hypothetical_protein [Hexamita inflata]|uniref:Hypothetical_protein n=1 Tax=Hexamita inflata TaxID=28002 RepID=A0AA86NKM9_9EUKA|nr:Hypothetical protein HINF_LOCUS8572 [Hexamita inflata]
MIEIPQKYFKMIQILQYLKQLQHQQYQINLNSNKDQSSSRRNSNISNSIRVQKSFKWKSTPGTLKGFPPLLITQTSVRGELLFKYYFEFRTINYLIVVQWFKIE